LRRLPRFEPIPEQLGEIDLGRRAALPGHLFGVVVVSPTLPVDRFVEPLREALAARGLDLAVEWTHATAEAEPREALEARLRGRTACVTVGALGVAWFRPKIAVAWTGGSVPSSWSPAARALRPAFDLELAEPRPGVFAQLAVHPSITACPGGG
jgi:hypothetical protein